MIFKPRTFSLWIFIGFMPASLWRANSSSVIHALLSAAAKKENAANYFPNNKINMCIDVQSV
jgi:hypothetical protein